VVRLRRAAIGEVGRRERGVFSFVEVLLASLVLALSATATAYWVETVNSLTYDADEQTVAGALVKIAEGVIASKPFREKGSNTFGPESGETLATFDDLDDFHGLVSSPPFDADLAPQTALGDWKTSVTIQGYNPLNGQPNQNGDLRVIKVIVEHRSREVLTATWLRTRGALE
jgi:hypothetical protein